MDNPTHFLRCTQFYKDQLVVINTDRCPSCHQVKKKCHAITQQK